MNLMTVDAQRVVTLVETFNQLWSAPLQICVAVYFLYVTMGVAVMAGLVTLLLLIPLNLLVARLVRKIQVKTLGDINNNFEYLSRITLQYKVLLSIWSCKLDLD